MGKESAALPKRPRTACRTACTACRTSPIAQLTPNALRCTPPPWDPDACARPLPSGTKQKGKANVKSETLFRDMSWAPFAKKNRHSESNPLPSPCPASNEALKINMVRTGVFAGH